MGQMGRLSAVLGYKLEKSTRLISWVDPTQKNVNPTRPDIKPYFWVGRVDSTLNFISFLWLVEWTRPKKVNSPAELNFLFFKNLIQ